MTQDHRKHEHKRVFGDEIENDVDDPEFDRAFNQAARLSDIDREKDELQNSYAPTSTDIESRKRQLATLEAEAEAIEASLKGCNAQPQSEEENYFILTGDYWKVRFNGGKEAIIGAKAPIKTLVEYLRKPGTVINPSEVYSALHGSQPESASQDCNLMAKASVSDLNCDATKTLTPTDIQRCGEDLSEKIERKKLCTQQGKTEEAETLDEDIDKISAILQKEYGVVFDGETGKIISANRTAKGRDRAAENARLHIKRAIEDLKGIEGLSEHLEIYLLRNKNKNIYQPPPGFPNWLISD